MTRELYACIMSGHETKILHDERHHKFTQQRIMVFIFD